MIWFIDIYQNQLIFKGAFSYSLLCQIVIRKKLSFIILFASAIFFFKSITCANVPSEEALLSGVRRKNPTEAGRFENEDCDHDHSPHKKFYDRSPHKNDLFLRTMIVVLTKMPYFWIAVLFISACFWVFIGLRAVIAILKKDMFISIY